jgi:hypothetical protein
MPSGDPDHGGASALRKLRSRWFAPSRPLAVDDGPNWQPAADEAGDQPRPDGAADPPSASVPAP